MTPVNPLVVDNFLQSLAHEMLHVNQGPASFLVSSQFRMGSPLGTQHRKVDDKAAALVTQQVLNQFCKAMNDGDAGCTCTH